MRIIYEIYPKKNKVIHDLQVNGKGIYVRIPIQKKLGPKILPDTFPIPVNMIMRMIKENPPSHTTRKIYHYTDQEREEIGRKNHEYIKSLPVLGTVKIKKNSVLPCLDLLEKPEEPKKKKKKKE